MTKQEFVANLRAKLGGLPTQDVEDRISFYCEMIDDRIEEGLSEEEAVSAIGSVDEIVSQIISDIPLAKIAREKIKPKRRLWAWEIVLLVLGAPIWLSLLIAAIAVILSLYAALWSVIISLWSVFGALCGVAIGGAVSGAVSAVLGNTVTGIALLGCALLCAGLSVFAFFGCKAATKGTLWLTKKMAWGIKKCFIGRESTK